MAGDCWLNIVLVRLRFSEGDLAREFKRNVKAGGALWSWASLLQDMLWMARASKSSQFYIFEDFKLTPTFGSFLDTSTHTQSIQSIR